MDYVTGLVEMDLFKPFNCERSGQGPGILDDASSGHGREEDKGSNTALFFQNREKTLLSHISQSTVLNFLTVP